MWCAVFQRRDVNRVSWFLSEVNHNSANTSNRPGGTEGRNQLAGSIPIKSFSFPLPLVLEVLVFHTKMLEKLCLMFEYHQGGL